MHRRFGCAFATLVVLLFAARGAVGSPTVPPAPATAAEAVPTGRLPRGVVPTHVGMALTIDPAQARFTGEVRVDVRVERATRTIWLRGRDLKVTRATITPRDGRPQPLQVTLAEASGVLRLVAAKPVAAGHARIDLA